MSAPSFGLGLVLVRPLLRSATTAAAKLKLRAGRAALHRALAPCATTTPTTCGRRCGMRSGTGSGRRSPRWRSSGSSIPVRLGVGGVPGPGGMGSGSGGRSYSTASRARATPSPSGLGSSLSRANIRTRPGLGPSLVVRARPGLPASPARAFSSGPSAARELGRNVPTGFRALADALADEERRADALRRGRGRGGRVMRGVKRARRAGIEGGRWKGVGAGAGAESSVSAIAAVQARGKGKGKQTLVDALEEFFPAQTTRATPTPASPVDTHLIIPLSPSLTPLFASHRPAHPSPATRLFAPDPPKRPALLAGAWDAVDPAHGARVAALLEALIGAGLLDPRAAVGRGAIEVIYRRAGGLEAAAEADALRVVVAGRRADEVRARMRGVAGLAECHLYEVPRARAASAASQSVASGAGQPAWASSYVSPAGDGLLYDDDAAPERAQWRMPVLDFTASASAPDPAYSHTSDDAAAIWATGLSSPRLTPAHGSYTTGYASSLSDSLEMELELDAEMHGSGWSTPVYSDHSASEMSVEGNL